MIKEEEIKSCTPFDLYQAQVKSISPFFNRLVNKVANCVLKDGTWDKIACGIQYIEETRNLPS